MTLSKVKKSTESLDKMASSLHYSMHVGCQNGQNGSNIDYKQQNSARNVYALYKQLRPEEKDIFQRLQMSDCDIKTCVRYSNEWKDAAASQLTPLKTQNGDHHVNALNNGLENGYSNGHGHVPSLSSLANGYASSSHQAPHVSHSLSSSPIFSPTQANPFYAGARFSDAPTPLALPKPPTTWMNGSLMNNDINGMTANSLNTNGYLNGSSSSSSSSSHKTKTQHLPHTLFQNGNASLSDNDIITPPNDITKKRSINLDQLFNPNNNGCNKACVVENIAIKPINVQNGHDIMNLHDEDVKMEVDFNDKQKRHNGLKHENYMKKNGMDHGHNHSHGRSHSPQSLHLANCDPHCISASHSKSGKSNQSNKHHSVNNMKSVGKQDKIQHYTHKSQNKMSQQSNRLNYN